MIRSRRIAVVAGIAFVTMFVAGMIILDAPGHDDSDDLLNDFYSQSSNRLRVIIAGYLWAAAGLAFLWFLEHLRYRLGAREGGQRELSAVMFGSGAVFVGMLFAAAAAQNPTYAISIDVFDEPQTELSRAVIPHIGYGMLLYGMLAAGLTTGTTSVAILQTGVFPVWMAWVGFLVSLALLFSLLFIPMFALTLWVLAMSIVLLRQPEESAVAIKEGRR